MSFRCDSINSDDSIVFVRLKRCRLSESSYYLKGNSRATQRQLKGIDKGLCMSVSEQGVTRG